MSKDSAFALPSKRRKESLAKAVMKYSAQVDQAETYLKGRGISLEVAEHFELGVVCDPQPGHEKVDGWLAIPYVTPTGVVDIKFRCMEDHDHREHGHPKYIGETGSRSRLFGVTLFQVDSPVICICEGELDVIAAYGLADIPAVGVSGTTKWAAHWPFCFEGYDEVIVLKDGDQAGDRLANSVTHSVYNSRVVPMPDGHDVNSFIFEHGAQALRDLVGISDK